MGKVFLDKVNPSAHIESIVAKEALKNGQFLKLGKMGADGETREAVKATGLEDADVFLVDAPLSYDHPDFDLAKYVVKAGSAGRAYHLTAGDVFSVTPDMVTGKPKAGDRVTVGEDGFGFKKAEAADGKGIGMLIGEEFNGFDGNMLVVSIG